MLQLIKYKKKQLSYTSAVMDIFLLKNITFCLYGRSSLLMEEHRLTILENKVIGKIFGVQTRQ
jgi:hypothetical protein